MEGMEKAGGSARRTDGAASGAAAPAPFSSTRRGALLLTGKGCGGSLQRQHSRLENRPRLLGFLLDTEEVEPGGNNTVRHQPVGLSQYKHNG
jgi:hypothetical protein